MVLGLVACGSAAVPEPTPTPTPPLSPAEVRKLLADVALDFSDLPPGYALAESGTYDSNEEVAKLSILGQETLLPKLEEWGRIMGYTLSYEKGSRLLIHTVDLYEDKAGAIAAAEWVPPGYESEEEYLAAEFAHTIASELDVLSVKPSDLKVEVKQISFPNLGDSSGAISVSLGTARLPMLFNISLVCEVKGAFNGCVGIMDLESEAGMLEELEATGRAMDRKLD